MPRANPDVNYEISIHALLAESDMARSWISTTTSRFLSTLSLRRATNCHLRPTNKTHYFYPRSPCGERQRKSYRRIRPERFLSTLSLRRATRQTYHRCENLKFLSTLSLRRATRRPIFYCRTECISIHALLAESDSDSLTDDVSK